MDLIRDSNVNSKFAKFVYTEVHALTNESKDFKTALKEYLKDNGQYLNTKQCTYVDLVKGSIQQKNDNQIINDKIRGIKK